LKQADNPLEEAMTEQAFGLRDCQKYRAEVHSPPCQGPKQGKNYLKKSFHRDPIDNE